MSNNIQVIGSKQPVMEEVKNSSQASTRNRLKIGLALLSVYLIWGSTYFAIRVALEGFPPFLMAGIRFLIAGGGLYLFLRIRGSSGPGFKQWLSAALVGGLLLVGGNGGVVFAEQWVASSLAAVGVATMPLWALLLAGLWGRWPARFEWLGVVLGFIGVILLNIEGGLQGNPLGIVLLIGAALSWALGTVWSAHLTLPAKFMSSAAQMLAAGAMFLVLGLGSGERMTHTPGLFPLLALLYLITIGSLVGFSAYNYLLQQVRPALATSYAYVNPVVALGLGVGLGGEKITLIGALATLVILTGVGLVTLNKK